MPSSVVCLSLISSVVNSPVCLFDHLLLSILTDLPYLVFACERFQLLVFILIQGFCIKGVMKKLLVGPYLVIILLEFSHFLFTLIFFFLKFIFFKFDFEFFLFILSALTIFFCWFLVCYCCQFLVPFTDMCLICFIGFCCLSNTFMTVSFELQYHIKENATFVLCAFVSHCV